MGDQEERQAGARPSPSQRWGWAGAATAVCVLLAVGGFASGRLQRGSSVEPQEVSTTSPVTDGDELSRVSEDRASTTITSPSSTTTAPPITTASQDLTIESSVIDGVYVFPVDPSSAASFARSHHDYPAADIFAPCGSDVVAPHAGTVQEVSLVDTWSSSVDSPESRGGLSFSIVGDDGVRYYGSHLRELDQAVRPGRWMTAGQRIGAVGDTGNAKGSGCHLHFGISAPCGPGDVLRRRGEFWPQQYLDAWRGSEPLSPAPAVAASPC